MGGADVVSFSPIRWLHFPPEKKQTGRGKYERLWLPNLSHNSQL
jgi:hypothetical protein